VSYRAKAVGILESDGVRGLYPSYQVQVAGVYALLAIAEALSGDEVTHVVAPKPDSDNYEDYLAREKAAGIGSNEIDVVGERG
jgi:hypothetical protein